GVFVGDAEEVSAADAVPSAGYVNPAIGYIKPADPYVNSADGYINPVYNYMNPADGYMNLADRYVNDDGLTEASARDQLQQIYSGEVGVRELTGRNDGKRVAEYLRYTDLGEGYAWCA